MSCDTSVLLLAVSQEQYENNSFRAIDFILKIVSKKHLVVVVEC